MKVYKIIFLSVTTCIWIIIIGTTGYIDNNLYLIAIIVNTTFFIVTCCYITKKTILRIWLISFSLGCSLFAGTFLESYLLDNKLYSFDIDGDTIFGESEQTEEQQIIFKRVINDSNVLLRYTIAFPYSIFMSITGVTVLKLIEYIILKLKQNNIWHKK